MHVIVGAVKEVDATRECMGHRGLDAGGDFSLLLML